MALTLGGLQAAWIENMITHEKVDCTFNPYEYTIAKQNQWDEKPRKGKDTPKVKFKSGGAQTLKLKVILDTAYNGSDVRSKTDKLMEMMLVTDQNRHTESDKSSPPGVAFTWGSFQFKAILKSMTQKFTLFDSNGKPMRCECDLTLQQFMDQSELGSATPGASSAPSAATANAASVVPTDNNPVATVNSSDRIDNVVASNGGNPNDYRATAEANNMDNPLAMRPGSTMSIANS